MADTTERALRLLGLLQRRPVWSGPELAERLGVTTRSIRRDVERLRALGYPVHATQGAGGGYQLGPGTRLPPLLLDDEEAIATAVSLRLAAGGTVAGVSEAAVRTLAKLDQVLPARLRAEVRTLHGAIATLDSDRAQVDADLLVLLARACRDRVRIEFDHVSPQGVTTSRRAEPVQLVATTGRWYLLAFDLDRDDWRTFRLDRVSQPRATTLGFADRHHPDPVGHVQRSVTQSPYRHVVRVLLHADAAEVRSQVSAKVAVVEPAGKGRSTLTAGGDELDWIMLHIARLGHDFEVIEPPELSRLVASLAERLTRSASAPGSGSTP